MESFGSSSTHGYSRGFSCFSGSSITPGQSVGRADGYAECISCSPSYPYTTYTGTPFHSYTGDPATIARGVFQHAVQDALRVLQNCGALQLAEEREWCLAELQRMLLELFTDDMA